MCMSHVKLCFCFRVPIWIKKKTTRGTWLWILRSLFTFTMTYVGGKKCIEYLQSKWPLYCFIWESLLFWPKARGYLCGALFFHRESNFKSITRRPFRSQWGIKNSCRFLRTKTPFRGVFPLYHCFCWSHVVGTTSTEGCTITLQEENFLWNLNFAFSPIANSKEKSQW